MKLDAVIRRLMPREERFQELLALDTDNLVKAAQVFGEIALSDSLEDRRVKLTELKALEHNGDKITRRVFDALNASFITPLDREDIRSIASDLDDILDYLEGVAQHLVLFELEESTAALQHFAEILVAMVEEVERITDMIWDMANEPRIHQSIVRISDLENRADALYYTAIADLFKGNGVDPIEIMKWKEVYQGLEDACDECKEYTHIVGNIVAKNG